MKVDDICILLVVFLIGYFLSRNMVCFVEGHIPPATNTDVTKTEEKTDVKTEDCFPPGNHYTKATCCGVDKPSTYIAPSNCWGNGYTHEKCCCEDTESFEITMGRPGGERKALETCANIAELSDDAKTASCRSPEVLNACPKTCGKCS